MPIVARKVSSTMSGMYCLWNQSAFASIHDYESWERLLCEDTDIEKQISSGAFVPINIRSDGVAEIEIRVGSREQPESLSERENSYLGVSSAPYLLRVLGPVFVSGIEHVEGTPSANCEKVDLAPGAYAATVNLIDWTAEPGMLPLSSWWVPPISFMSGYRFSALARLWRSPWAPLPPHPCVPSSRRVSSPTS